MTDAREGRAPRQHRARAAAGVIGYVSAGAEEEEALNWEFEKQAEQIVSACEQRELSLVRVVREREPRRGHTLGRPALGYALQLISAGDAQGLVVAELSRLAHSPPELGRLLEWFISSNVRFIAAALGLDTQDEAGRLAAYTIIEISRWEHERLAARTRKGMLAARRKGPLRVEDYPELKRWIARMRADGLTLQAIADRLNDEGVPTVRGGTKWRPSSVQVAAGYRRPASGWPHLHPHIPAATSIAPSGRGGNADTPRRDRKAPPPSHAQPFEVRSLRRTEIP